LIEHRTSVKQIPNHFLAITAMISRPSTVHTVMEVQGAVINSLRRRVDTLNRQVASLANSLEQYLESESTAA